MTVDVRTFDVGISADSPETYAEECLRRVEDSWAEGAEVVLFPEFLWVGLERFVAGEHPLREVSRLFWSEMMPRITGRFSGSEKAAVLGTAPFWDEVSGHLRNRALIFTAGRWLHQDKLNLTPWEKDFTPGSAITLWEHAGFRIAVIVCLDIEVPEIAARLRGRGVDLILCPSATETILGVERVDRCASARAVELGCHVAVAHLVGAAGTGLIDGNVGRAAVYHPSQPAFESAPRWIEGDVETGGFHLLRVELDPDAVRAARSASGGTNPAILSGFAPDDVIIASSVPKNGRLLSTSTSTQPC